MNRKELGQILTKHRQSKGISRYRICKETGMKQHQVRSIEHGSTNYTIDSLMNYMKVVGVGFEDLIM